MREWLQPRESIPVQKSLCGEFVECRPTSELGKADALWEETSTCTMGTAGVRAQASGERFAEITPGRAYFQQGRAATCKDSRYKGRTEVVGGFRSGA